jgi:predicted DNA-binding transcriptional regulator AlpA
MRSKSGRTDFPVYPAERDDLEVRLWSLSEVLNRLPVGRSTWLCGVKRGLYPEPVRLSPRRIAWRPSQIQELIDRLGSSGKGERDAGTYNS